MLYDGSCPLCRRFRYWLQGQPSLVRLRFLGAGSEAARAAYPGLDHAATLREITVVADTGEIWTKEHAWAMCLWVTVAHHELAERLARPAWLPVARVAALAAAGIRGVLADGGAPGCGDGGDSIGSREWNQSGPAGSCEAFVQG